MQKMTEREQMLFDLLSKNTDIVASLSDTMHTMIGTDVNMTEGAEDENPFAALMEFPQSMLKIDFARAITGADFGSVVSTISDLENGTTAVPFATLSDEDQKKARKRIFGSIRRNIVEKCDVSEDAVKAVNIDIAKVNEVFNVDLLIMKVDAEHEEAGSCCLAICDCTISAVYVINFTLADTPHSGD